jgi:hypothetical protein
LLIFGTYSGGPLTLGFCKIWSNQRELGYCYKRDSERSAVIPPRSSGAANLLDTLPLPLLDYEWTISCW